MSVFIRQRTAVEGGLLLPDASTIKRQKMCKEKRTTTTLLFEPEFSKKPVLRRLFELYKYDASIYEQSDVNEQGIYDYKWIDHYWTEEDRYPFLIRCNTHLAGFALVRRLDVNVHSMAEFFVMKKYRRLGVGQYCAHQLFRRFAGRWMLTVYDNNDPAKSFWQKTINEISSNLEMSCAEERNPAKWHYQFLIE